ncbi:MAG: asparagine synthase (glutamine-hydrolyzing) [Candidatus Rifleibacteriota bacterium]
MCGIAGFSGNFDNQLLRKMIAAVSHRGPDDQGEYFSPELKTGMAQARLAIIDLSEKAHQPMSNEDNNLIIVFNGEIYNFPELKRELSDRGHRFKSNSDTEVLLHLYEEEGPDMLKRLNGIFAFAVLDKRANNVFLARDHFGIKPLYLAETCKGILFCSEIKGFLPCKDLSREIDPVAVNQHLSFIWCPAPRTMFKSVRKLPPGSACLISEGKIQKQWQWYKLPYDGNRSALPEADLVKSVENLVSQAVRRQLLADVPVGAFLSGGLDSSAIVAMMRKHLPQQSIRCYSIGFADEKDNEGCPQDLPYAEKVAKHLAVDLCKIEIKPEQLIERLGELIWFLDEPQADPAPVNAMFIAEQARKDGVKVLLSGAGGDDIFTGYRRHLAIKLDGLWNLIPASFRKAMGKIATRKLDVRNANIRRMVKVMQNMHLNSLQRLIGYYKWSQDEMRHCLFKPDFAEKALKTSVEAPLIDALGEIPAETDPINQMLFLDTKFFLADHNLNYTDKTCMRYGVEARVPLLDPDLVKFAAGIPTHYKQTFTQGKAIFKKAMESYLPHDVIYRPKTHFGAPLRRWIRNDLQEIIARLLSRKTVESRGIFAYNSIEKLVNDDKAGKVDGSYIILSLLCIEIWCQLFIDGTPYTAIKI